MIKRILLVFTVVIVLVSVMGCSVIKSPTGSSSSPASYSIARSATISPHWLVKQIKVNLAAGKELPIIMKLADGDYVEGLFYLEEGKNVNFSIAGSSIFYQSTATNGVVTSDSIKFTANINQGIAYTLSFRNPITDSASSGDIKIFLELKYPDTALLFIPIDTKQT
jgi:hypothetical protein